MRLIPNILFPFFSLIFLFIPQKFARQGMNIVFHYHQTFLQKPIQESLTFQSLPNPLKVEKIKCGFKLN